MSKQHPQTSSNIHLFFEPCDLVRVVMLQKKTFVQPCIQCLYRVLLYPGVLRYTIPLANTLLGQDQGENIALFLKSVGICLPDMAGVLLHESGETGNKQHSREDSKQSGQSPVTFYIAFICSFLPIRVWMLRLALEGYLATWAFGKIAKDVTLRNSI